MTGLKSVDVTIMGTAPSTSDSAEQEQACIRVHTRKEVLKWCGTSWPNNIIAEHKTKGAKFKGHSVIEDF
eukprot:7683589-Ditylum_brightwellii.AAC.1